MKFAISFPPLNLSPRHCLLDSYHYIILISCMNLVFFHALLVLQEQSSKMRKYVIESVKKYIEVSFLFCYMEELAEAQWNFVVQVLRLH